MNIFILFQGLLVSKGRTFESSKLNNQDLIYNCSLNLNKQVKELKSKGFKCIFLIWENEINELNKSDLLLIQEDNLVIKIPNIEFPRGKLLNNSNQKNKLLHYYAMSFGINYLIQNNIANSKDLMFRCRTDIVFNTNQFNKEITKNIEELRMGKILTQYWMEDNPKWFIDFIFGANSQIMFELYNSLYKKCLNNNDYAYSVHQDLIKAIASIYLPKCLIISEGSPKALSRKELNKIFNISKVFTKYPIKSPFIKTINFFTFFLIKISFFIAKIFFLIYRSYEKVLLYSVMRYCLVTMSFKFQSSINWRGSKCTDDLSKFIIENKNSNLVFSEEN